MRFAYRLSEAEFVAASRLMLITGAGRRRLLFLAIAMVLLLSGLALTRGVLTAAIGLAVLPAAVFAGWLRLRHLWRRAYRRPPPERWDITVECSAEALTVESPLSHTMVSWQAYSHFVETKDLFLLVQHQNLAFPVPKRALPPDALERFRELVAAGVAGERPGSATPSGRPPDPGA